VRMRHDKEGGRVEVEVTIMPEMVGTQLKAAMRRPIRMGIGRMGIVQPCFWYPLRGAPPTGSTHPRHPPNNPVPLPHPLTARAVPLGRPQSSEHVYRRDHRCPPHHGGT